MTTEQLEIVADVLAALDADQLELPVLPDMALKIRSLIEDSSSSTGQFVQLVSTDLSISLYIIKVANSAAYCRGRPVANLHDAIPHLGYRMLFNMVMTLTMTKLFRAHSQLINNKLKELWEHSRNLAACCYVLAQQRKYLKQDQAILAGLVHDIGALPLYLYADRHHPNISENELVELTNKFSTSVGIKLLRSWHFPDELVDVIAGNENKKNIVPAGEADYADVVALANQIVMSTADTVSWTNVEAAEALGYFPEDCKNFISNHAGQFAEINEILNIGAV